MIAPAMKNTTPVAPRPPLILAIGAVLGVIGGAFVAGIVEFARRRVRTSDDLAEVTDAPMLGAIPRLRHLRRAGVRNRRGAGGRERPDPAN